MLREISEKIWFVTRSTLIGLGLALIVLLLRREGGMFQTETPTSFANAVARAAPAVVSIHTAQTVASRDNPLLDDPLFQKFFRIPPMPGKVKIETSLGSGVIVDSSGYILTNYHVIRDAERIQVVLYDGALVDATVVGNDPESDLSVLKIAHKNLPQVVLGDSNSARIGDVVLAIGNPLGVGQTVTQGIVSATGRNRVGINTFENFIQTDAAINPGNSGGALINVAGELVGINAAILGYQGIGFAIPTSIAVDVMRQLIEVGSVARGWIGVDARDLSQLLRAELKATSNAGIAVLAVMPGGPAAAAGIRPGDVITHIGAREIHDSEAAINAIASHQPGTQVQIRGTRFSAPVDFEVRVAKRPSLAQ